MKPIIAGLVLTPIGYVAYVAGVEPYIISKDLEKWRNALQKNKRPDVTYNNWDANLYWQLIMNYSKGIDDAEKYLDYPLLNRLSTYRPRIREFEYSEYETCVIYTSSSPMWAYKKD